MQQLSRLGIFVFYDSDGVVDRYVWHLLQQMQPHLKRLVIVSNSPLNEECIQKFRTISDDLLLRDNQGLDAAAYKAALVQYCGWSEVEQYDEVILFNNSFFGPIHSFEDMFKQMGCRNVDFWGMSAGYETDHPEKKIQYGYVPDHIQTFFVCFRKRMVSSPEFREYWENYNDQLNGYLDVVYGNELIMTRYFQDRGFQWDVYADTEKYRSQYRSENMNLYLNHSYEMMKKMNFPVLKKKVLCLDLPKYLFYNDLEEPSLAVDYISNQTNYDVDMIWESAIRQYDPYDLCNSRHGNYILAPQIENGVKMERAALIYHISNPFLMERMIAHASKNAEWIDVYAIVDTDLPAPLTVDTKISFLKASGQSTPMGGFLLRCREILEKYDYVGFVRDIDNLRHDPVSVGESTAYGYLKNIADSRAYVAKIIRTLEEEPKLGLLAAPFPIHHNGFGAFGNMWGNSLPKAQKLNDELDLACRISEDKPPLTITGAFWCRSAAMLPLWRREWKPDDFLKDAGYVSETDEALKRLLPFVAKSAGYYSGIVMHTEYAGMRLTDLEYMLQSITPVVRKKTGCYSQHFLGFLQQLRATAKMPGVKEKLTWKAHLRILIEKYMPSQLKNALIKWYSFHWKK